MNNQQPAEVEVTIRDLKTGAGILIQRMFATVTITPVRVPDEITRHDDRSFPRRPLADGFEVLLKGITTEIPLMTIPAMAEVHQ